MPDHRAFKIVTADDASRHQFTRWHELLKASGQAESDGEFLLPRFGFKFALRADNDLPVPDCDLSWGIDAVGRTVQINPAASAGDANVLSAIGEDRDTPSNYAVLRQGRLHPNRENRKQIRNGDFRHAFQKLPVSAGGSFGARGREWYLVCDLSDDAEEVARQTADFVERCARVRAAHRDTAD